ncbi:stage III sporulation protein AF [Paenibacillus hexagrammi]|uniref:Stage III sporulation protein AF n=1 Tax=Paenibacillus hexagrammi TaxID=2908839 RepID=A0ABY3SCV8_9BACL|nr:stage III sporulation protein AF [Paenibacillus sp. YPD9-1]UJF31258.1 stage III sporulation protein AF [Paenibacillus sp. YPD9-1]
MDWLGGWLKSVIMVILLATFVDLLLPSNTMQRYVKTVLSLFVLLTLLSPVMQLFQKDWNVDRLLSMAESKQNGMALQANEGGSKNMKSLNDITKEAQQFKNEGDKQSIKLIQSKLAEVMKEDLQNQTDLVVSDVQVLAQIDNNGKPAVTDVTATLHDIDAKRPAPTGLSNKSIGVMEPMKPIDPIHIDIQNTNKEQAAVTQQTEPEDGKLNEKLRQEREKLTTGISRDWQVKPDHIHIRIESDSSKL